MSKTVKFLTPSQTRAIMTRYADACEAADRGLAHILREMRDDVQARGLTREAVAHDLRHILAPRYLVAVHAEKAEFTRRAGCDMPQASYDTLRGNARQALSRALKVVFAENAKPETEPTEAPASITLTAKQEAALFAAWEALDGCSKADFKAAVKVFLAGYAG